MVRYLKIFGSGYKEKSMILWDSHIWVKGIVEQINRSQNLKL